ncbi:MAG: serine hydrolase [Deltaproteobacteria bacterium]|nr:serine hydrolase [Deltaproteobacteria bacterium]
MKDFLNNPEFIDTLIPVSTPVAEGISPEIIQSIITEIETRKLQVHSLLIIKNGKRVCEQYGIDKNQQLTPNDKHVLYSTTKTFTSMLIGLCINDGFIKSVDQRILDFFDINEITKPSSKKNNITIKHLLTMHSGLKYLEGTAADFKVFSEACSACKFLSRSMVAEPGIKWNYSTADSQILAEIIRRATGVTPFDYANEKIFKPLNITDITWDTDASGTHWGGIGLYLRPRDLARFGLMLINEGKFANQQIIPSAWIKNATTPQVTATSGWDVGVQYGYHCWVPPFGGFATQGYMGQNMYVLKERNLIVVFTAELSPPKTANTILAKFVQKLLN